MTRIYASCSQLLKVNKKKWKGFLQKIKRTQIIKKKMVDIYTGTNISCTLERKEKGQNLKEDEKH
jgi:hypothetical protein